MLNCAMGCDFWLVETLLVWQSKATGKDQGPPPGMKWYSSPCVPPAAGQETDSLWEV